jgi:REP element-mobilizing transposase RayT
VEILEHSSPGKVFVAMDRRLDGAATGPRWLHFELMDERVAQVVADALGFGERRLGLYQLRAWVLMVNHVHILIHPGASPSRITKAIKNHSARQANAVFAHHWAHRPAVLAR